MAALGSLSAQIESSIMRRLSRVDLMGTFSTKAIIAASRPDQWNSESSATPLTSARGRSCSPPESWLRFRRGRVSFSAGFSRIYHGLGAFDRCNGAGSTVIATASAGWVSAEVAGADCAGWWRPIQKPPVSAAAAIRMDR